MFSKAHKKTRNKVIFIFKNVLATMIACCGFLFSVQAASSETRSLKLYYIHTHEKAEIVFKKNGKYVDSGLKQLNVFLRDWRRNEPTKMDPRLFDLIWQVYKQSGSRDYIHVVSAYRSPTTNNMLRSRSASSGVAKNSQHTLGRAMDFYIPGANLSKLRQIGLKQEVGGVGYYPRSGSPFVHMDVGNVRHWPRMSRSELLALFPDGKTIHIPSDGKPLPRYQQAMAEYNARKGRPAQTVIVKDEGSSGGSLFARLFGGKKKQVQQEQTVVAARPPVSRQRVPQIAPQEVEQEAIDDMIDLPDGGDAPIPLASPARTQETPIPNAPIDNLPPPQDSVNALIANANSIPVPDFKPGDVPVLAVTAQPNSVNRNEAVNAMNDVIGDTINADAAQSQSSNASSDMMTAYNIPIPTIRNKTSEIVQNGDEIAAAIAQTSTNQQKLETTTNKAPIREDEVNKIIKGNGEFIPLPDEDYADNYGGAAQAANSEKSPVIDNSLSVASVNQAKKTNKAAKTNKDKTVEHVINNDDEGAKQELHKIPALVFASGLKKEQAQPQNAKLTGRAINFQAIAHITNSN